MRKYQCHKVVEAAEITHVASGFLCFEVNGERFTQPRMASDGTDLFARGRPRAGDYLVRYRGGYLSWSPKVDFEDGYTLIRECKPGNLPPALKEIYDRAVKVPEPRPAAAPAAGSPAPHQKPSVGAIVHYFSTQFLAAGIPRAAIIEFVHDDGKAVNLTVFAAGPRFVAAVPHKSDLGTSRIGSDYWAWPWERV